jgi:hypothetical protein
MSKPELIPPGSMVTEDEAHKASLTVCDPARGLTVEEASEVLKALGLKSDPLHEEAVI